MLKYLKPTTTPQQNQLARRLLAVRSTSKIRIREAGETLRIAQDWLTNNHSQDDLRYAIGQFDDIDKKISLATYCVNNCNRNIQGLREALELFENQYYKSEIAKSYLMTYNNSGNWEVQPERKLEDFREILPFIEDSSTRSEIAGYYLATYNNSSHEWEVRPERTLGDLREILPFIEDSSTKSEIAKSYLATYNNNSYKWEAKSDRNLENLREILPFIEDSSTKSEIAKSFFDSYYSNNPTITHEEFKQMLPLFENGEIEFKLIMIRSYLEQPERKLEDFREMLQLVENGYNKSEIAKSYLATYNDNPYKWEARSDRKLEDFREILPLVENGYTKSEIAKSYLATYNNNSYNWEVRPERTLEDFREMLPLVENGYTKSDIAQSFFDRYYSNNPTITHEEFKQMLPLFENGEIELIMIRSYFLATYNNNLNNSQGQEKNRKTAVALATAMPQARSFIIRSFNQFINYCDRVNEEEIIKSITTLETFADELIKDPSAFVEIDPDSDFFVLNGETVSKIFSIKDGPVILSTKHNSI